MKKIYFTLSLLFSATLGISQNWSNVGSPYFSTGTTSSSFLYFGDMEIDAAGNIYVGYWDYGGKCNFAKYNGTSWNILPSPGTFAVSFDDIEIRGTDYYYSYMGARGTNLYAYVKKYDGSSTWNFVGDSILIGGTGQGGSFDFLLDNNGVPTLIGIQKAAFQEKTVKQFISGAWVTTYIIPKSNGSLFKEGSAIFDASNKLNCIMGGNLSLPGPPYVKYYTIGLKIDGATSAVIADTIYVSLINGQFRMDNAGNSYMLFNNSSKPAFLSYKLNGSKWDLISDTVGQNESMLYTDVSSDGKVFFNTNTATGTQKSMYSYIAGVRSQVDSINYNGIMMGAISDLIVRNGNVYALIQEGHFSVMKHTVSGGSSAIHERVFNKEVLSIYPNPANGILHIDLPEIPVENSSIQLYDIMGKFVFEEALSSKTNTILLPELPNGTYLLKVGTFWQKLQIVR